MIYLKDKHIKKLIPILEIKNLTKYLQNQKIIDNINLKIYKGEIFILLGSSGCGKSTLLRLLAGLEKPTSGKIFLNQKDISNVPPYYRPINMMFQSFALFPHMSVEQNISFGLKQDKLSKKEISDRVKEMLLLVDLYQYAKRKPHQLSGGQKQRVALARSIAKRPQLLLLDEPMGSLDEKLKNKMQFDLITILKKINITSIIVTHDQKEAMKMAERIAIMHRGKFEQIGNPKKIYENPKNLYIAEFIGSINIFTGILRNKLSSNLLIIDTPELKEPIKVICNFNVFEKNSIYIAIRPEKINFYNDKINKNKSELDNFFSGEVINISYLGNFSIYYVRLELGKIISVQLQHFSISKKMYPTFGQKINLFCSAESFIVLTN